MLSIRLFTRKPEEILHEKGFSEIEPFTGDDPNLKCFMARIKGSEVWHYAHVDSVHCLYINLAVAFIAKTGKLAIFKYIINRENERIQFLESQTSVLKHGLALASEEYEKYVKELK